MDAGQLEPGLDGEVGKRVSQQRPQVLGTEQFPARRRDISPVHDCAGLDRADEGCREAFLDPGLPQDGPCLAGQGLGPVPLAACHRHQRPLAQCDRDIVGRADLLADPDRILQVLTNLLSNAIKFSPSGTTITVQIDSDLNSVLLKVVDRGRGIPSDKLELVFGRFQQVEASDASKKGGTGLGLSIVKEIMIRLGGDVAFEPAPGGGTIFHLDLPRWDPAGPA